MPNQEPTLLTVTRPSVLALFAYVLTRAIMDDDHTFRLHDVRVALGLVTDTVNGVFGTEVSETEVREILQRLRGDGLIELVKDDAYRVVRLDKASRETEA